MLNVLTKIKWIYEELNYIMEMQSEKCKIKQLLLFKRNADCYLRKLVYPGN